MQQLLPKILLKETSFFSIFFSSRIFSYTVPSGSSLVRLILILSFQCLCILNQGNSRQKLMDIWTPVPSVLTSGSSLVWLILILSFQCLCILAQRTSRQKLIDIWTRKSNALSSYKPNKWCQRDFANGDNKSVYSIFSTWGWPWEICVLLFVGVVDELIVKFSSTSERPAVDTFACPIAIMSGRALRRPVRPVLTKSPTVILQSVVPHSAILKKQTKT